ncbi:molybdopterin converting factor subunit 1 [Brevibacillus laterosporus]|uniref:molybdopterin converting factor subunit 1 n=1 Tax=Brevibacillus laterosporus TaxID=1465 RepID=UPI000C7718BE|nr:molybdopterin converting factor subunit 1 [Brevibacillus laterosporus]AUM66593.1 molybdopterin converting factor subunit 1 [Brevibacillus laterosporus]
MQVTLLLFAGLAERAGQNSIQIELPDSSTVQDLLDKLPHEYPALKELLSSCFVSVNQEYADHHTIIKENDEVAILPPVSGGEEPRFAITEAPLSVEPLIKLVSHRNCGAILTFIGTVREMTQGQRTVYLAYEAYIPMAIEKLKQVEAEIHERWENIRVAIHHRIGDLQIEEIAVVIAVSSPHRNDSFEAGRYAIERLKQIVPIWKKEIWEDGNEWKGHQLGPWNPTTDLDSEKK